MIDFIEETTLAKKRKNFAPVLVVANKLLVSKMNAINLCKTSRKTE